MTQASKSRRDRELSLVSYGFKVAIVFLFFLLTFLRLILIQLFPQIEIIPDKVFLFIALFVLLYLWIQGRNDFSRLLKINRELEESQEQLKQAEIDAIASLVNIEEAKDLYTKGHSERVTQLALAIADEMNLSPEARKVIARAGILHDIGKIGISDGILHKKEKLTDEDWRIIKKHSETGFNVLSPFKFLSNEREIILSHHERPDGKGYPKAIKAGEIRLEAMILAVADAFDAMNSKRSYRESLTQEAILEELTRGRDKQHSAAIVDIFIRLLKKNPRFWNLNRADPPPNGASKP